MVSEWDGWIWLCYNCDYQGEKATDKEVEKWEQEIEEYRKKKYTP